MGVFALSIPLLAALALSAEPRIQPGMPIISSVEPAAARVGDVLIVHGENLGGDRVAALYLTDGKIDIKVPVLDQSSSAIKFRIPVGAKPGRMALMVLTREAEPKLVEQPVKVTIESDTSN